jgi:hypothetical protein
LPYPFATFPGDRISLAGRQTPTSPLGCRRGGSYIQTPATGVQRVTPP